MDLIHTIAELRAERDRLDKAIAQLETLAASGNGDAPTRRSNRGRKYMDAAERLEVSKRMKAYWASRRKAKAATA